MDDHGLNLLHADEAMLVFDKPSGLLSVPGRGPDKQDCLSARAQAVWPDAWWCTGWTWPPPASWSWRAASKPSAP
ncbi:ribosomal large subunit pseudouridine synthase A [Hydrogenophaga taeniospiralis CCUG 15921]|uniref:Ribosomal large subunit pseudouridine synthase A n=1 Tax=Hydrogenophaga taeniospiralis CCUG 15921 TaxID=1281780 RepID=A0A9X4NSH1_9BURK|nr:ribosomal large subunit pseudouridine synthase A [Hydrogenophaga taeniospiralis CCUG 15921]